MKVTMDTFRDLGGAFIAALVLIFLLMVVYYKSFAIAGIILLEEVFLHHRSDCRALCDGYL